jgi:hypothetical protein
MKISTGISEIGFNNFLSNNINHNKIYVWPRYNAGLVEKTHDVLHRTESDIVYTKPLPEDRERLLARLNDYSNQEYSYSGKVKTSFPALRPGSFFDAFA